MPPTRNREGRRDRDPAVAPFVSIAPRTLVPLILTCEHASHRLPASRTLPAEERRILRRHWGHDIGAWQVTRRLSRALGASAIGGRWSRLWIDLNRRVDDPTLIRQSVEGRELSWNARLGPAERERRVLGEHAPYHEALDRLIIRRLVRGVRPLLLAIHTFTPSLNGARRTFEAGVLFEQEERLARALARELRRGGLRVRYNEPYSGIAGMMYSVDRHGKHHGLPCLELELNQALFADPARAERLIEVVESAVRRTGSQNGTAEK